jgi:hypothetical protein
MMQTRVGGDPVLDLVSSPLKIALVRYHCIVPQMVKRCMLSGFLLVPSTHVDVATFDPKYEAVGGRIDGWQLAISGSGTRGSHTDMGTSMANRAGYEWRGPYGSLGDWRDGEGVGVLPDCRITRKCDLVGIDLQWTWVTRNQVQLPALIGGNPLN